VIRRAGQQPLIHAKNVHFALSKSKGFGPVAKLEMTSYSARIALYSKLFLHDVHYSGAQKISFIKRNKVGAGPERITDYFLAPIHAEPLQKCFHVFSAPLSMTKDSF